MLAFPGANRIPAFWNTSTASGVQGMLAPSPTAMTLLATNILASSPLSSFWVAQGRATSTSTFHKPLTDGSGALGVKVADGYCLAYSEMRPRRLFLRSMTHASFSRSMPSGSWMNPEESEKVTGFPLRSSTFLTGELSNVSRTRDGDTHLRRICPWWPTSHERNTPVRILLLQVGSVNLHRRGPFR